MLSRICGADDSGHRPAERSLPKQSIRFWATSCSVCVVHLCRGAGISRRDCKHDHVPSRGRLYLCSRGGISRPLYRSSRIIRRITHGTGFSLWVLIGTQAFRVGVELFIHQLWIDGLVPKMLTFAGANVDIYIGASALVIAWLSMRGWWGQRLALLWNILGLLSLANVVTRAVLTAPGPLHLIHAEVPNRMIGTFPFMFIPGFFVPLAVVLHVLAIRSIVSHTRTAQTLPSSTSTIGDKGLR